ncbi:hypothetical protein [Candidatus Magnetobacterium casense]|uniref:Uncharacterized protein n=1 Tax=Candidatus Magnetobacterium casense TaxID=1455061 RepID=A0ABS6RWP6_9BACT|nr:hypothetical protein [Candidatus Magnetobacterium casensis]MBV6341059.1 hypothetical protein [Candidatus Magnetobacterium casensis]
MKILSFDVSARAVGWAFWDSMSISCFGTIEDSSRSMLQRLRNMDYEVQKLCGQLLGESKCYFEKIDKWDKNGKPKKVTYIPHTIFLIEDGFVAGKKPTLALGKARYMVENVLFDYCEPIEDKCIKYFLPAVWRKALFGEKSQVKSKEQIVEDIRKRGYDVKNDDEADAVGMLLGYFNME